uniref:Putative nuclease n=1 Tax=viral metagenome TaxID=1070528 RepID=A0A6M3KVA0_9ZZZZ
MGGYHWIMKRKRLYMKTADYSIEGHESSILIERKSVDDLVSSVTRGHRKLEAEHQRMLAVVESGGFACLICEGSFSEIDEELRCDGRDNVAETLMGCAASWPQRYRVPWYFAGDRRRAELLGFRVLWKWWNENHEAVSNNNG